MFDNQLIPEFGGVATDEPVIQLIQHIEMICDLCKNNGCRVDTTVVAVKQSSCHIPVTKQRGESEFATNKTGTHSCLCSQFVNAYTQFVVL